MTNPCRRTGSPDDTIDKIEEVGGKLNLLGEIFSFSDAPRIVATGQILKSGAGILNAGKPLTREAQINETGDNADIANQIASMLDDIPDHLEPDPRHPCGDQPDYLPNDLFDNPPSSPLVVDLGRKGIELTALFETETYFDLRNWGDVAHRTGWIGKQDGFLALDRNSDGVINGNRELFGSARTDGFTELRREDTNRDGVYDRNDATFSLAQIWIDRNQDGWSQSDELFSLAEVGIASIDLNATEVDERLAGHKISHRSSVTFDDGDTGEIIDVWFQHSIVDTRFNPSPDFALPANFELLPALKGFGRVPDVVFAAASDEELAGMLQTFVAEMPNWTPTQARNHAEEIVVTWAGKSWPADVVEKEAVLEAFMGRPFGGGGRNAQAAIAEAFDVFVDHHYVALVLQVPFLRLAADLPEDEGSGSMAAFAKIDGPEVAYLAAGDRVIGDLKGFLTSVVHHAVNYESGMGPGLRHFEPLIRALGSSVKDESDLLMSMEGLTLTAQDRLLDMLWGSRAEVGTKERDTISGLNEDEVFLGGRGDDVARGAGGEDTYVWFEGHGNDVIDEYGSLADVDRLFLADLKLPEVEFSRSSVNINDLEVRSLPSDETITIDDFFSGKRYAIEEVAFSQGRVLDRDEIVERAWYRGSGARDSFYGSSDDEVFDGGGGVDIARGGLGSDTYVWFQGDGNDVIDEYGNLADNDRLLLADLNLPEVEFSRSSVNSNDLEVRSLRSDETITVDDFFSGKRYAIEEVEFANGRVLERDNIADRAWYRGSSASDSFYGSSDDEVFDGGGGVDIARGSLGSDTYVWFQGDGNDVIDEYGSHADLDRLFLADLKLPEVEFSRSNVNSNDLEVRSLPSDETITVDDFFSGKRYAIEEVELAKGRVLERDEIVERAWYRGSSAKDSFYGSSDDEVFDGGSGADLARGGAGSDTYVWFEGDGSDVIDEYGLVEDKDRLVLADLTANEVMFQRSHANIQDLKVRSLSSGEVITVDDFYRGARYGIESVEFADGERLNAKEIADRAWYRGSSANDSFYGSSDDEVFDGGGGVDIARGGLGSDTYVWFQGDGNDVIDEYGSHADLDSLFLADLKLSEVEFSRSNVNTNDLEVRSLPSDETITVDDFFSGKRYAIEEVEFAKGRVLDRDEIVERAWYRGSSAQDRFYGSSDDETFLGGAGNDQIWGGSGHDVLNGGAGTDSLNGGKGNDTFIVDKAGDVVQEYSGGGHDVILSRVDYSLSKSSHVEGLTLLSKAIVGSGNALDNEIVGNSADNLLLGLKGDDSLIGQSGADTLDGGFGKDHLEGGNGRDVLYVSDGDTAFGGAGSDHFMFDDDAFAVGSAPQTSITSDFDGRVFGGAARDKLVFAEGLEQGNFAYVRGAAFSGSGNSEARYAGSAVVKIDVDGDGRSNLALSIEGLSRANQLTVSDFVWM